MKKPTDATIRNVRAGNKRDAKQEERLKTLERKVKTLEKAVERLIRENGLLT